MFVEILLRMKLEVELSNFAAVGSTNLEKRIQPWLQLL